MKAFNAAIVTASILAGPAFAQLGGINSAPTLNPQDREAEARAAQERAAIEKDYNETMKRSRSEPAPKADPWSRVRPADTKR